MSRIWLKKWVFLVLLLLEFFFFTSRSWVSFSTKVFLRCKTSLKYLGCMTPGSHSDYCLVLSRASLSFAAWYFTLNRDTLGAFIFCFGEQLVRDYFGSQGFFWTWKFLGKPTAFLECLRDLPMFVLVCCHLIGYKIL